MDLALRVRTYQTTEVGDKCLWVVWLFPRLRGFGETVRPVITRPHFLFCFVLFSVFEVDFSSRTLIPLARPGAVQCGSAD